MSSCIQVALVILISIANAHSKGSPWDWQISRFPLQEDVLRQEKPSGSATTSNVTVLNGATVTLPCRINQLKEHTVSWLRVRDSSVLSVGRSAFSSEKVGSDEKYSVLNFDSPERGSETDWNLLIRQVTKDDEGWYDCQINTEPKINHKSYLRVLNHDDHQDDSPLLPQVIPQISEFLSYASHLHIRGPNQRTRPLNATLSLECVRPKSSSQDDVNLYWTLNQRPIEPNDRVIIMSEANKSLLTVHRLSLSDEGSYACRSDLRSLQTAEVQVTVASHGKPIALPQLEERSMTHTVENRLKSLESRLVDLEKRMNEHERSCSAASGLSRSPIFFFIAVFRVYLTRACIIK